MTNVMRAVMLAAVLVTGATGACGGKGASTTPAGGDAIGDDPALEMERTKDAICACQTLDCLNQAGDRLNAVSAKFEGRTLTAEQADRVHAADAAIDACIDRITSAPEDERVSPPTM